MGRDGRAYSLGGLVLILRPAGRHGGPVPPGDGVDDAGIGIARVCCTFIQSSQRKGEMRTWRKNPSLPRNGAVPEFLRGRRRRDAGERACRRRAGRARPELVDDDALRRVAGEVQAEHARPGADHPGALHRPGRADDPVSPRPRPRGRAAGADRLPARQVGRPQHAWPSIRSWSPYLANPTANQLWRAPLADVPDAEPDGPRQPGRPGHLRRRPGGAPRHPRTQPGLHGRMSRQGDVYLRGIREVHPRHVRPIRSRPSASARPPRWGTG